MSTRASAPIGLGLQQPSAASSYRPQRNVLQFNLHLPQSGQMDIGGSIQDTLGVQDTTGLQDTTDISPQSPLHGVAPSSLTTPATEPSPHRPEPLSDRLGRLGAPSDLESIHSEMLDRYAEAEAEQTEDAESDWHASRIADSHAWASMENNLDALISDYEKRHHRANIYVAGGIGGAAILTLIGLCAILAFTG